MVSQWKSHQDLVKWMEKDFSFDSERFKRFEQQLPPPRTPEETFRLKSGIYIDAAIFARESLNRINPSYKAQLVVIIMRPYGYNHYLCSFRKDGSIYIMDYGTPSAAMTGVQGPFKSLDDYKGRGICRYTVFEWIMMSHHGSCGVRSKRCSSSAFSFPRTFTPFW
jgi:hypothetical protein